MKQSSKQQQTIKALNSINTTNDFFFEEETGVAKFIKGRLSNPSNDEPETIARFFLEDNTGLLDLQEDLNESPEISHIKKDKQGFSHVYYTQSVNGIPIFESSDETMFALLGTEIEGI